MTSNRRSSTSYGFGGGAGFAASPGFGAAPPAGADLADGIRDLASKRTDRAEFLNSFGHRGTNEMELAQPRWSESPQELDKLVRGAR